MRDTFDHLRPTRFPAIVRQSVSVLQVNVGYRCNQTCLHCHVNAGPNRKEELSDETLEVLWRVLETASIHTLDLTGGAPELHPRFRQIVQRARAHGKKVIDRCNLTILTEPGQADLAAFLAQHQVEVVASLPCYLADNVDRQRGDGVFERSLQGLLQLNALGYGAPDSGLVLNLVYNPQGAQLPPPQAQLERDYQRELHARYGIRFNRLFALANLPINRFASSLKRQDQLTHYLDYLEQNHQPANLAGVMCRQTVSVDWQGYLYDCDFNQQLGWPIEVGKRLHLSDLSQMLTAEIPIAVGNHCFACTAGQGSSCGGAL